MDLVASCYGLLMPSTPIQPFRPDEPMIFLDSIRTNENFVRKAYSPDEFASITLIKGDEAIRLGGEEAKNGIVYIFTNDYVRTKYWNLFREISAPFAKAVSSPADVDVVYILNDKILTEKTESELFLITKDDLVKIQVIEKEQLKKQFGKKGRVGIILTTRN